MMPPGGCDGLGTMMPAVMTAVRKSLLADEGLRVREISVEKTVRRPFSEVVFLRVTSPSDERRLVLKKVVHHQANRGITLRKNQAVVEYDILRHLHPQFQTASRCNVPKPVAVLPEHEAFVMEYVDGALLGDLFRAAKYTAPGKDFDALKEYYFLCGVWLRKLREFTGVRRAGKEALTYSLERSEQKLRAIEEARCPACPPGFADSVRALLREQADLVRDEEVLTTGRHGDFGNWNIMASHHGITVFDFLGYEFDLLPVDLLKMLTNFEDEATFLFFSKSRINSLRDTFLEGYGEIPVVSKALSTICETLHRVCCVSARTAATPRNLFRRIEHKISLSNHVAWLLDDHRKLLLPQQPFPARMAVPSPVEAA